MYTLGISACTSHVSVKKKKKIRACSEWVAERCVVTILIES